jgi:hypothetical protein
MIRNSFMRFAFMHTAIGLLFMASSAQANPDETTRRNEAEREEVWDVMG